MCATIPFPVGKLFAQRELFEFADGGARNRFDEDESVRELPFGEGFRKEAAKLLRRSLGAIFQNDGGERPFLPFRVRDADHAGFLHCGWPSGRSPSRQS